MKFTSTGSEDIYLGVPGGLRTTVAVFQVETPLLWSGSLIPMQVLAGAVTKLPAVFTRITDDALLSGSISGVGSLTTLTTGSYAIETLGGDVFLRHVWNSGSVDIYATILPD